MPGRHRAIVQTGAAGRPVLAADSLNLEAAEAALIRDAVKHAETLTAAATMLGLSVPQLRSKARQLRVALPFTAKRTAAHE